MPYLGITDNISMYTNDNQSNCIERPITVDVPRNYFAIAPDDTLSKKERNVFSDVNDKVKLVLKHKNYLEQQIDLRWKDLTLKTDKGVTILDGLYGSAYSGELTAVMGPSGSGKTSLLNVLTGFIQKRVTGDILVNGCKRDMKSFKGFNCYILQDDCILPLFTVRELITIASRLKIPSSVSEKERMKAVDNCISSLGLIPQQHQKAHTLSGGQRKRLCIAQEIVNNPPLVFLDEPTNGLDSASSLQCIQLLKSMAEEGRNVITTIHQPSSRIYEMFDKLYMMANGQCIYQGPAVYLPEFLSKLGLHCPKYHNPTDFLTDVSIGVYGEWNWKLKRATDALVDVKESWSPVFDAFPKKKPRGCLSSILCFFENKVESLQDEMLDLPYAGYPTTSFNQFRVLLKRNFLNIMRDPMAMKLKLFGNFFIGIFVGSLFYQTGNDASYFFNFSGLIFTTALFLIITAQLPTVLTFPAQRRIVKREYLNGWYSIKMFHMATTFAELPFQIFLPMINCSLVYWLSGQPPEASRFCYFMVSAVLVSLISESIGLIIGASNNIKNGIYLASVSAGLVVVMGGTILPLNKTPWYLKWMAHLSFGRYTLQSMFINLYKNRTPMECSTQPCYLKDPQKFLELLDMDGDFSFDMMILIAFFLSFRFISYLILYFNTTRKR